MHKPAELWGQFSNRLERWMAETAPRTLDDLVTTFGEKSFAILFLLLMSIPALPLPTGGVTHIFEVINMLIAIELIAGRRTVWLPKKWGAKKLKPASLKAVIRWLKRVEKFSRPRQVKFIKNAFFLRCTGLIVLFFTLLAFLAPPFSGLDTLPSLGVVLISVGLLLEDIVFYAGGILVAGIGIGLVFTLSRAVINLI